MKLFSSPMGWAACAAFVSALLFLAIFLIAGMSMASINLLGFALVWGLMGAGLMQGWRWLAYLGFLLGLGGLVAAYMWLGGKPPIVGLLYAAISVANAIMAACLFIAIWRPKKS